MRRKPKTGYDKLQKVKKKKNHYIGNLLVTNPRRVSFKEKFIKFMIYIALRIVIRPKKWKDPKKNYEIIDRTYKRIMSSDFIFIPSSIAFYLIMAFMPIISLIMFLYQFESIQEFLSRGHWQNYTFRLIDPNDSTNVLDYIDRKYTLLEFQSLVKLQPTFIVQVISETDWKIDEDLIKNILGKFVPGMGSLLDQVSSYTKSHNSKIDMGALAATISSLFISTWIAAGGFSKLVYTQSYLYGHKFVGGYWMNKIKGMVMVVIFSGVLFLALATNIYITKEIDASTDISESMKPAIKMSFLVVGLFFGVFVGFIALFKLSPRYSIRIRDVVPGAMVATIPTAGFLSLFGYVTSLWSYGNYGTIGTIMYLGMASLIVVYFIFVGLATNVAYFKTFVSDKVKTKWTISKK